VISAWNGNENMLKPEDKPSSSQLAGIPSITYKPLFNTKLAAAVNHSPPQQEASIISARHRQMNRLRNAKTHTITDTYKSNITQAARLIAFSSKDQKTKECHCIALHA